MLTNDESPSEAHKDARHNNHEHTSLTSVISDTPNRQRDNDGYQERQRQVYHTSHVNHPRMSQRMLSSLGSRTISLDCRSFVEFDVGMLS